MTVRLALIVLAACSGKPRPDDAAPALAMRDAGSAAAGSGAAGDAAGSGLALDAAGPGANPAGPPASAAGAAKATTGDLQIRVIWPDVPIAARSSPGKTPCQTPRAPQVAPTVTWGVPDVLVIVDGAVSGHAAAAVTLADCAIAPRLTVGNSLAITSATDRPAKLVLRKRGTPDRLVTGDPVPVMLPIAGHTVTTALDAGAIYTLETDAASPEVSFIAAVPDGYVTDSSGHAVARELAVGSHTVTAWLPPRAGQPARTARGTAKVAAGELTELIIALVP